MGKKKGIFLLTLFSLIFLLLMGGITGGCAPQEEPPAAPIDEEEEEIEENENEEPEALLHTAILYFSNEQADGLKKEEREIRVKEELEEELLRELIKGPETPELVRTIPEGTEVISVTLENNTAVADFSSEFQTEHWGGSTGEMLTVYSVVNTLAELPDVEEVKFLLQGEEVETLAGHLDLLEAVAPRWDLVQE